MSYREYLEITSLYMWDPKHFETIMGNIAPKLNSDKGINIYYMIEVTTGEYKYNFPILYVMVRYYYQIWIE